jgi:alpha-galactosidase
MAAPLLIGSNIRNLSAWDLETYTNIEVIHVDQDPLGVQGSRIAGGPLKSKQSTTNVWGRPLRDKSYALVFLNNGNAAADIACDQWCFKALNVPAGLVFNVRDLWQHKQIGSATSNGYVAKQVPPNGGSVMLQFSPVK